MPDDTRDISRPPAVIASSSPEEPSWIRRAYLRGRTRPATPVTACSPDHQTPAGGENLPGIEITDNQDRDCFSIVYTDPDDPGDCDVIHFCDWPALRAAIDKHQRERGGRI